MPNARKTQRMLLAVFASLAVCCATSPSGSPAAPQQRNPTTVSEPAAQAPAREIHPQPDQHDCVQMYGSCTPLPDRVCTSQAFVVECGKTGRSPTTHEALTCVCP
jgi:hypothetical protein